jgi:hypothetical protein
LGIADSISDDLAELPVALDVAAWYDVYGSMAARGVMDITSRISRDEDDEASLWWKSRGADVEVFWPVAHRIYRALAAALRRESARSEMRCEMAWADRSGYI